MPVQSSGCCGVSSGLCSYPSKGIWAVWGCVGRETCLVLDTPTEGVQDTVSDRSDMNAKRGCGHIEMLA